MKNLLISGAAAAAILAGGAAIAQTATQPQTGGDNPHAHMMTMKKPTARADVQAQVATMFARLDTDKDGFISRDEADAMHSKHADRMQKRPAHADAAKRFAMMDANHDGQITAAELDAFHAKRVQARQQSASRPRPAGGALLARGDTNKDGVITRAEFDAMVASFEPQASSNMRRPAMRHHGMMGRMFESADLNKDARVSLAEAQQAALVRFDKHDLNRDGTISPEERQQSRQLRRAQRKAN